MQIIAKLAIVGTAIAGLSIAGAGTALAEAGHAALPRTVNMTTIPADGPFDDFDDLDDYIHGHIADWQGWHHNWHPNNWRDDDWDDDRWDD